MKYSYPCPKCAYSEMIDFAKPHIKECPNCKAEYPKFDIPSEEIVDAGSKK